LGILISGSGIDEKGGLGRLFFGIEF